MRPWPPGRAATLSLRRHPAAGAVGAMWAGDAETVPDRPCRRCRLKNKPRRNQTSSRFHRRAGAASPAGQAIIRNQQHRHAGPRLRRITDADAARLPESRPRHAEPSHSPARIWARPTFTPAAHPAPAHANAWAISEYFPVLQVYMQSPPHKVSSL